MPEAGLLFGIVGLIGTVIFFVLLFTIEHRLSRIQKNSAEQTEFLRRLAGADLVPCPFCTEKIERAASQCKFCFRTVKKGSATVDFKL